MAGEIGKLAVVNDLPENKPVCVFMLTVFLGKRKNAEEGTSVWVTENVF